MVNYLDEVFGALADPTRRAIVERLTRGEASVGEIAARFPVSLPAVSRHLRVLEEAGVIERRREGRTQLCRLRPARLRRASGWIATRTAEWERRLDRLAAYLEEER